MILIHLSVNGNPALLDVENILFAEECESKIEGKKTPVKFTRVYLKQPIQEDDDTKWIDIKEKVLDLLKEINQ